VQCAREAGGETPDQRGGVDGCNVGTVVYAEADSTGVATGLFPVRRTVTTPLTGTVDCAAEADRCIVAMGAIDDYDRSGGFGFTIAGGGEPIDVPTLTVTPAEGLEDGAIVRVEGDGYQPRSIVSLQVCAKDPAACWTTGVDLEIDGEDAREYGLGDMSESGTMGFVGLAVDADGRLSGDVPVWRFLPGGTPGTYVDCAVSACSLRVSSDGASAPPAPLGFTPGGEGPVPPAVAVDPANNLAPGDTVVIRGAGFGPAQGFFASLCVGPADRPEESFNCFGGGDRETRADDAGTFAIEFEIPDPQDQADPEHATTTAGAGLDDSGSAGPPSLPCVDVQTVCTIRVDVYDEGFQLRPTFPPAPVVVTFRAR